MPSTDAVAPIEVTETVYGVEAFLDLPLILVTLLLAVVAARVSKRNTYLLLAIAVFCFGFKQSVFYLGFDPTPSLMELQRWAGTHGWLLMAAFAAISVRRH
jgi:hypothetical protein